MMKVKPVLSNISVNNFATFFSLDRVRLLIELYMQQKYCRISFVTVSPATMKSDVCCRHRASKRVDSAANARVEPASNAYEMPNGGNSQPVFTTDQSVTSTPADSDYANIPQPPLRSSVYNDVTFIDNYLYT